MDPTHRSTPRRLAALLMATAIALGVSACSDDTDAATPATTESPAATTEEPTSEQPEAGDAAAYVDAGNALCDEAGAAIEEAFPDFEGEPTIEQVMTLGADLGPVLEGFRDDIAALDPPAESVAGHQALLDALDEAIATLDDMATSEAGAQAALDAGGPPLDAPSNAAHALFPSCPAGDEE